MGWKAALVPIAASVHAEPSFLASEHAIWKRVGITVDSSTVGADANGDKVLKAGTVMGKITSTGKFAVYTGAATNGAGTATPVGFLAESINLRWGDVSVGLLEHGSVLSARCSGLDSSAITALAGRVVFQ